MGPESEPETTGDRDAERQAYSPWTVVDVIFEHLTDRGLRPTLGSAGDPAEPAAALLRTLGVTPTPEGDPRIMRRVHEELAEMRAQMEPIDADGGSRR